MKGGSGKCTSRLSICGLALAFGVVSALSMGVFAWTAFWTGHGNVVIAQWAEFFPGFAATVKGGWIGFGWGFLEGIICGIIFGIVYNLCLFCCKCCCCGTCDMPKEKNKK